MMQPIDEDYLREIAALDGGWARLLAMLTQALDERDLHQRIALAVVQRNAGAGPLPAEHLDRLVGLIQRLRASASAWQRDDALDARYPKSEAELLTEAADALSQLGFRGQQLWRPV